MNKKKIIAIIFTIVMVGGAYYVGTQRQKSIDIQLTKNKLDVMFSRLAYAKETEQIDTETWSKNDDISFWQKKADEMRDVISLK